MINFEFKENGEFTKVATDCLPRQTNLDGIFHVTNWFQVDPTKAINTNLDFLVLRGLIYESTSSHRHTA